MGISRSNLTKTIAPSSGPMSNKPKKKKAAKKTKGTKKTKTAAEKKAAAKNQGTRDPVKKKGTYRF